MYWFLFHFLLFYNFCFRGIKEREHIPHRVTSLVTEITFVTDKNGNNILLLSELT